MIEAWGELNVRETFAEAARTFADLVRRIPPNRWDGPGLGEWDLRSLVGHTSRSLITVETYLGQPADTEEVPTPAAYYVAVAGIDPAVWRPDWRSERISPSRWTHWPSAYLRWWRRLAIR